jgi:hypothetical protein
VSAVWELVDGHAAYWAVAGALEAGVLDEPPVETERLAPLLALLVDGGVLARDGDGRYRTTPTGEAVRSMRGLLLGSPGRQENWLALGAVLRGDDPPRAVDDDVEFRVSLARATYDTQHELATRVAAHLAPSVPEAPVVVDLSPVLPDAPRPWSDAFPDATSGECRRSGSAVARTRADVVLVPHVCREGDGAATVADAVGRATAGGHVVIADYFLDAPDRDRARRAAVLGLTMVANTTRGTAYPESAYRRWLTDAGVAPSAIDRFDGRPAPHDVLIARTPTEEAP